MSIVTISRGSYSRGKEVAEKLAEKLSYECVSREIIIEASAEFNIPEIKFIRALHNPNTVLERFQHGKERYLSYHQYALLKHVAKDNVVYHGLAGHYLLKDVAHVLKVRITSNFEDRVKEEMRRENLPESEAVYLLKKDDEERRKWSLQIFGADTWDSRLYDIVLNIDTITIDDAVEMLYDLIQKKRFQTTAESKQVMEDMKKVAQIKAMLINISIKIEVMVEDDVAFVSNVNPEMKDSVKKRIEDLGCVASVEIKEALAEKSGFINPYYNI